jgi:hypothetical protein
LQGSIFGGGNPQHDIPAMLERRNVRGIIRYADADRG